MKSSTCKSSTGQYLEEYHSKTAADLAAQELQQAYGNPLSSYQCRACGYWHLTGAQTRRQCHFCTDSSLFLKDIYATREEALTMIARLRKEAKIQLYPYKCPHGSGWHLTKRNSKQ